jgi:zinc and cadmium transporter
MLSMQSASAIAVYLMLIAGISLAGGVAPLVRSWSREKLTLLVSAGSGVLLGAAFVHMLPLATESLGRFAGLPILAGFLAIFVLEQFFLVDPCEEVGCEVHSFGFAAFLGITFHSLIDGVAVGSSLIVPNLAPPVFLAIVIHKIPAAFSLCSILLLAGYSRSRALLHICGFSTATPIGAILSYLFLSGLSEEIIGIAIGVSAGSFLAIATSNLLPQLHREGVPRGASLAFLLAGVAVMVGSAFAIGH